MAQVVRMPKMGNTMERGTLVEWAVDEGERVDEGDLVAVVESEKASLELGAEQAGVLARADVAEGASIEPGTVLGIVARPDESLADAPPPRSQPDAESAAGDGSTSAGGSASGGGEAAEPDRVPAAPGARRLAAEADVDLGTVEGTGPDGAVLRVDVADFLAAADGTDERAATRTFASPTTRRRLRRHGLSVDEVAGTGRGGRVTESDARAAVEGRSASALTERTSRHPEADGLTVATERELTGTRATIAERMADSARTVPQVTLDRTIDASRARRVAVERTAAGSTDVGFSDLLLVAVAAALDIHPAFNAWFRGQTHHLIDEVNVAVAVDADGGLVTPVIRGATDRAVADLAAERARLTDAALAGEHDASDLQGGTFTITNLGMFGVDAFTPLVVPPQVGILGIGRIADGSCTLSLSFDHRPVDGADAARFMESIVEGIEAPAALLDGEASDTGRRAGGSSDSTAAERPPSVAEALERDVRERTREIADHHDWPLPTIDLTLSDGRVRVVAEPAEPSDPATTRRLVYAACRESRYSDTMPGLRDPALELR